MLKWSKWLTLKNYDECYVRGGCVLCEVEDILSYKDIAKCVQIFQKKLNNLTLKY